jgi:heptosyltransferase-2
MNVVLVGSKDDRDVSQKVAQLSQHPPFDLAGETTIDEAAALLSGVDLLIANDMGLAHLAPAVGTTTLVIFGPTDPVTTRPFSENASIITAGVECSPCMLRECPIDHRCMTRVLPDDVFERARAILET